MGEDSVKYNQLHIFQPPPIMAKIQPTVYLSPIPHDIKSGKRIIKTVRFDSRFFEVKGKRYMICSSGSDDPSGSYCIANVDTGEFRTISGDVIRKWLDI